MCSGFETKQDAFSMRLRPSAIRPLLSAIALFGAAVSLVVSPANAGVIAITDLIEQDPLGYECIPSSFLDEAEDGTAAIAFSLTGKSRLPRTCLPNPCDRALTPRELSNITGTEMILARFSGEWDDYYARYADYCRAEVVLPTQTPQTRPTTIAQGPVVTPVAAFWPPIIERSRKIQRLTPPSSNRGQPVTAGLINPPDWGIPNRPGDAPVVIVGTPRTIRMLTSAGGSGGYEPPDSDGPRKVPAPAPSPVPIPASGLLLLGALFLLGRRPSHITCS
jgi:hypothetical protein